MLHRELGIENCISTKQIISLTFPSCYVGLGYFQLELAATIITAGTILTVSCPCALDYYLFQDFVLQKYLTSSRPRVVIAIRVAIIIINLLVIPTRNIRIQLKYRPAQEVTDDFIHSRINCFFFFIIVVATSYYNLIFTWIFLQKFYETNHRLYHLLLTSLRHACYAPFFIDVAIISSGGLGYSCLWVSIQWVFSESRSETYSLHDFSI